MKILLLEVGKTKDPCIQKLAQDYQQRLGHYIPFHVQTLPDLKKTKHLSEAQIRQKEALQILEAIRPSDHLILLDEKGKQRSSIQFSEHMQHLMNRGLRQIVFVIGGAYGFDEKVYQRADEKLGLSSMTFSHQIIRPIFMEQLYRIFTILRNEPYHHQ